MAACEDVLLAGAAAAARAGAGRLHTPTALGVVRSSRISTRRGEAARGLRGLICRHLHNATEKGIRAGNVTWLPDAVKSPSWGSRAGRSGPARPSRRPGAAGARREPVVPPRSDYRNGSP